MKRWKHPAAYLLLLLIASSLLMALVGTILKHTVARDSQMVQDTMAVAVPFVMLRGDVMLEADSGEKFYPIAEVLPPPLVQVEEEKGFWDDPRTFAPGDAAYFDDALFIGDSRTVGLSVYGRLGTADYFADVGMSVFNLFDKSIADEGFESQSLQTLLTNRQYHTIYIMLGINELGYPLQAIETQLMVVLDTICQMQPEAAVVLIGNLPVTEKKAKNAAHLALANIIELNEMIASHADGHQILYLWSNPNFLTESGYLQPDVTGDGVHPYAVEYANWSQWISNYGVTVGAEAAGTG